MSDRPTDAGGELLACECGHPDCPGTVRLPRPDAADNLQLSQASELAEALRAQKPTAPVSASKYGPPDISGARLSREQADDGPQWR